MTFSKQLKTGLFTLSLGIFCLAPHAQAGFQWIPGEEAAPAKPTPVPSVQQQTLQNTGKNSEQTAVQTPTSIIPGAVQSAPSNTELNAPISVVPQKTVQSPDKSVIAASSATSAKSMKLTINPFPKNSDGFKPGAMQKTTSQNASVQTPHTPITAPATSKTFNVVNGFGADIPLALALRQIVPPAYAYSFGKNVNPGYRVSWEGGKPWNDIVNDMLVPLNLGAQITGKTVIIKPADAAQPKKTSLLQRQNITDPGAENTAVTAASTSAPSRQFKLQNWEAWSGDDLKTTLNAWSREAGAQVQWEAGQNYRINNTVNVNSTFDQAVKVLSQDGFRDDLRPSINIQNGGKVIIVRDQTA